MKVRFEIDNIISDGKNPDTGKFDAAYCEEKYKLWTKAIFPTRIMW